MDLPRSRQRAEFATSRPSSWSTFTSHLRETDRRKEERGRKEEGSVRGGVFALVIKIPPRSLSPSKSDTESDQTLQTFPGLGGQMLQRLRLKGYADAS
ncbi:hypothetical protein E2C01_043409 [Portunus trituberculatus]|uniref:Uncharacterized protein n=1 Tax=Portunus trituberculatus TaxID=210409 RepID=A0A5B7FQ83_PORTR|nr:hypothetical protein [Portunus trituberculatus]